MRAGTRPGGERIFEYNRQPWGHQNYMISIGPDGKMTALRQILNPNNFAKVQPGMMMEDVRKLLGKPMKQTPYPLKNEVAWDWRYLEPPNTSMVFTVWFNPRLPGAAHIERAGRAGAREPLAVPSRKQRQGEIHDHSASPAGGRPGIGRCRCIGSLRRWW